MPRILVTTDPPDEDTPVTLDETVEMIHVNNRHSSEQLLERLVWAIQDAESVERTGAGTRS